MSTTVGVNSALLETTCNITPWVLVKLVLVMIRPFLNDETLYLLLDLTLPFLLVPHSQFLQLRKAKQHRTDIDDRLLLSKINMDALRAQLSL
jgi:hypothetical protein